MNRLLSNTVALCVSAFSAASPAAPLPPISSVQTDACGFFRVNGKPFFPILIYDAPVDVPLLQQLATMGFNTMSVASAKDSASLPAQGFYAAVHVRTKIEDASGVLFAIGIDSPVLSFKDNVIERTIESGKKISANCPGRPIMNAIGYWLNEPAGVKAGTLPGKDKYEDLVAAIDVSAPYLYPVPHQPVGSVGEAVARARNATGGKRPLLPILQLFSWSADDRYPTPTELRCMVNLALIEGATGIGYYTYSSIKDAKHPMPAELWQSVGPLNAEVAEAGSFFMESTTDASVLKTNTEPTVISWRAAKRGKDGLLLLANPTDKRQQITLNLPNLAAAPKRVDKAGNTDFKNGTLTIDLDPLEVARLRYQSN